MQTAATGATEFCIVAAVRGPDEKLMTQMREAVAAIREAVDINVAASLGILTREQAGLCATWASTATTTTSKRLAPTSRRSSPPTLAGTLGHPADDRGVRPGGLLRRHRGHGRES